MTQVRNCGRDDGHGHPAGTSGGVRVGTATVATGAAVTLFAGADAAGHDTHADVALDLSILDLGLVSVAWGGTRVLAAAQSADGSAYATSATDLQATGFDRVSSRVSAGEARSADGSTMVSQYGLDFMAVSFAWTVCGPQQSTQERSLAPPAVALSGNLAEFSATVSAQGENSFADLSSDAIAVEHSLSSVALAATVAAGDTHTYRTYEGTGRADTITTANSDSIVDAGGGNDRIVTGAGADWILAGAGNDTVAAGAGDDVVLLGTGRNSADGGADDDWLIGGRGADLLRGGNDNDVLWGGDGADTIDGGAGNDLIDAGRGNDVNVHGGAGDDVFRLGAPHGDGNDRYWGDAGADRYLLAGNFGRDAIADFCLGEGDRLDPGAGRWVSNVAWVTDDGAIVALHSAARSGQALVLSLDMDGDRSQLTLERFFANNPDYAAAPRGAMGSTLAGQIWHAVLDHDAAAPDPGAMFAISGMLSELG